MSLPIHVDLKTLWKGIGPAGKILRIIWTLSYAESSKRKVFFSEESRNWWRSGFNSELPLVNGEEGEVIEDPLRFLKKIEKESTSRQEVVTRVSSQYLLPNREILKEVEGYINHVCVYIRGTDKITERLYLPIALHKKLLDSYFERFIKCKIVVVTDSEYHWRSFQELCKYEMVCTPTPKSKNEAPLHLHKHSNEQESILRNCLLDVLVMARSRRLIYTPSMMVSLACLLNPDLDKVSVETMLSEDQRWILEEASKYARRLYLNWTKSTGISKHDFV